ncbi:MAG: hypothetical protein ABH828_00080 [archaeon]
MNKKFHVSFGDSDIKNSFEKLRKGNYQDKQLFKFINRAADDLKLNPFCGIRIKKSLIPKEYVNKFSATNLWKYNLPNAWRLIYTVKGDDVFILSIILDWFNHKTYEHKFKYK